MKLVLMLGLLFFVDSSFFFADAPKPPVVPDALKASFFKAQAQMMDANVRLQQSKEYQDAQAKQKTFSDVVQELTTACGSDFRPQMDAKGDPSCAIAPKAPVAPAVPAPARKP